MIIPPILRTGGFSIRTKKANFELFQVFKFSWTMISILEI